MRCMEHERKERKRECGVRGKERERKQRERIEIETFWKHS